MTNEIVVQSGIMVQVDFPSSTRFGELSGRTVGDINLREFLQPGQDAGTLSDSEVLDLTRTALTELGHHVDETSMRTLKVTRPDTGVILITSNFRYGGYSWGG